jgi:hypothetical protein
VNWRLDSMSSSNVLGKSGRVVEHDGQLALSIADRGGQISLRLDLAPRHVVQTRPSDGFDGCASVSRDLRLVSCPSLAEHGYGRRPSDLIT